MKNLTTNFANLKLDNPIIIASSGLTDTPEKCKKLEDGGAGAIILKSIFEEQIMQQYDRWDDFDNAEGNDYLLSYLTAHSLSDHINLIKEAKKLCKIPIIASINCSTNKEWAEYAGVLEKAGADAIELNIMEVQSEIHYQYGAYEDLHIKILQEVKSHTSLPIIVKMSNFLTNPIALIHQLYANGAAAVVLFNRAYRPDINIDNGNFTVGEIWTRPSDICDSLRWVGIGSAKIPQIDFAISGGVHDGWAIIKAILAGCAAVEVCTTIYWNGIQRIETMKMQMDQWMSERGYRNLEQFKAHMNAYAANGEKLYERTQFMKYFSSYQKKG